MYSNENEIQAIISTNYEDIRNELVKKYKIFINVKADHEGIFHSDINKQFVDLIHRLVTAYIANRCDIQLDDVKIYVEDKFTWDNIERIISPDGEV